MPTNNSFITSWIASTAYADSKDPDMPDTFKPPSQPQPLWWVFFLLIVLIIAVVYWMIRMGLKSGQ